MTKIEEYINKAFESNIKDMTKNTLKNVTINQNIDISAEVFDTIADAIKAQASANEVTAEALLEVARGIKGIKTIAINFDR